MINMSVSVGYEHNNTYKQLDRVFAQTDFSGRYKEELMQLYPYLFYDNSTVKVIHIDITEQSIIEEIMKIANISITTMGYLTLSLLWNFPRKKYNEKKLWACLSGFFYDEVNNKVVKGHDFVVSNNLITESASRVTDEIIEYINLKLREIP